MVAAGGRPRLRRRAVHPREHVPRRSRRVPQDDAETVHWYRLAAEQGLADAQYDVGVMYEFGRGVPQDDVQAHMWFNLAASRMNGEYREIVVRNRDRVAGRMDPTQIAEGQRLAREWDAAHPREP